jgi:hypothetical protein
VARCGAVWHARACRLLPGERAQRARAARAAPPAADPLRPSPPPRRRSICRQGAALMAGGDFGPGLLARLLASLAELRCADRALLEAASEVVLSKISAFANNTDNLADVLEAFQRLGYADERLQQLTDAYGLARAAQAQEQQPEAAAQQPGEAQR